VPPPLEIQPDSSKYIPHGEDSFKIVVTVPVGEDTQEAQQLM
jgi:chromosome condensin MukBEF MukE localization factor